MTDAAAWATWLIVLLATAGVILRPLRWPEAVWAAGGAVLLVASRLVAPAAAWASIARGADVYLFLTGMMLLSETGRREGLFDWVAAHAARAAAGSQARLFTLVFAAGTVVTIFLSNDATAVVLTPAVYATARRAGAAPLPLLFACAMVANAASFVLPISNPANLVLYAHALPPLARWLGRFALPSAAAILATWAALRWRERQALSGGCAGAVEATALPAGGRIALAGIVATAILLLAASAAGRPLGLPTAIAGAITAALPLLSGRRSPWAVVRAIDWAVLPLVAGLFVMVGALRQTGLIAVLAGWLSHAAESSVAAAAWTSALIAGFGCNLTNNLPAGLIASEVIARAAPPRAVTDSLMIAVDLGPNLSVTGSLATILWLAAIRREGEDIGFWRFLQVGAVAMPPALLLALAARLALG